MSHLYIVNSQKATAVSHSATCSFTGPNDKNLVLVKCNNLEIYVLRGDDLKLLHSMPVYGRIVGVEPFRSSGASTDSLFILTERKKICVFVYDADKQQVMTQTVGDMKERRGRDADLGQMTFMDPGHRVVGLHMYDSLVKVMPLDKPGMSESFNVFIEEPRVLSMTFLSGYERPTMCFLYEDNRHARHIKTLSIDTREKTAVPGPFRKENVEFTSNLLIPVSSPLHGVLVVGINSVTYLGPSGKTQTVEIPPAVVTAYSKVDESGTRYLISNVNGQLFVVALVVDPVGMVTSITTDLLGSITIAETLSYLDNGVVYIGSSLGDSQLIKLLPTPSGDNRSVQLLDTHVNLGPIVDMCVVDHEKNGAQRQMVTCSGYDKAGSLRIIRSGVGIQEQASLEIPGVKGLWSLRTSESSVFHKFLVQSFVSETRILAMQNEELGEIEIPSFQAELPTLFCGNMLGELMLQVTAAGVRLIHCTTFDLVHEQFFARNITVATANLTQVVLALTGGELVYLELTADRKGLTITQQLTLDQDIACLSIQPANYESGSSVSKSSSDASSCSAASAAMDVSDAPNWEEKSPLLAVGMWTDNTVRLFALPQLAEIARSKLDTEAQARDLVLLIHSDKLFLFVGMGDGVLISYTLDSSEAGSLQLQNRRKGVLGTHPVSFTRFFSNVTNDVCVFAACDRPTVIYIRNGKVLFSMLDLRQQSSDEVTSMAPFHTELFPGCLALGSESALVIGTVEDIQKVHVRTVPLNEGPRRIAYSIEHGVYAVLTEVTEETDNGPETRSRVLFFDDAFERTSVFELDVLEQGCSLTLCAFEGCEKPFFVVGTGQVVGEELEPSRGRVLIFDINPADKRHLIVAERGTKSAVYSLAAIAGKLAAGIANRVQLFRLSMKDERVTVGPLSVQAELVPGASIAEHIVVLYLKAYDNYLLVGDVQRSVSLLRYKEEDSSLEEVARDFNSAILRSVEFVRAAPHLMLASDDHGNLIAAKYRATGGTEEEQSKLQYVAEFNLSDYVNVMRPGSIVSQPLTTSSSSSNGVMGGGSVSASAGDGMEVDGDLSSGFAAVDDADIQDIFRADYRSVTGYPTDTNSILFGTISGMVGSILVLNESSFVFFQAVQNAVKKAYQNTAKGLLHEEWRAFRNDYRFGPPKNVVDGDLVERLLEFDRAQLEAVTRDVNDELTNLIQPSSANAVKSNSVLAMLTALATGRVRFTPEEILRRVEDIARLH